VIIKEPPVYDISHWKIIKDFSAINPRPVLMLTKATECYPGTPFNNITDPLFAEYFAGMKAAGIARGAFHFFRKAYSALKQAEHFVNVVKPHITDKDILMLDVEEGGEKASQLWAWFHYVRSAFPNNICMLYSRKSVLDLIVMTQSERDYFKQIPVWTSGYPDNPDLLPSVPSWYIPDQTRWGQVLLWQYSEKGAVEGIVGAVDLNWMSPALQVILGDIPKPQLDLNKEYQTLRRFGSDGFAVIADLNKYEVHVTNIGDNLETVSHAANRLKAKIAINGDGWPFATIPYHPISLAASDGIVYQRAQFEFRPFLGVAQDKTILFSNDAKKIQFNTVSGTRWLIQDGVKSPALSTIAIEYFEKHPRTAVGKDANGKLVILVVEGRSEDDQGVMLSELADIMLELGCIDAVEFDGGGSSALWYGDRIVNMPSDGQERAVINHLVLVEKEVSIPEKEFNMKGVQKEGTSSNLKPVDGVGPIKTLLAGEWVYGNLSATGSDIIGFTHYYNADGVKIELDEPYKVSVTNLIKSNEVEPTGTPAPTPEPEPTPTPTPALDWDVHVSMATKTVRVTGEGVSIYFDDVKLK